MLSRVLWLESVWEFVEAVVRGDRSWWPFIAVVAFMATAVAAVRAL